MAKHPDWSTIDPATQQGRYWTSTASVSAPTSGYWTDTASTPVPNFVRDRGVRSYATTPGFNKPNRVTLVKPLSYTATYETKYADRSQFQWEIRSINVPPPGGGPSTPVDYYYQYSTNSSHNIFANGFIIGDYDASSVDRRAVNKLLDNMKDQKINLAQAFAEREQTIQTLTSTAKTVAKALSSLKSGNFAGAAKALGIKPPKRGQRRFNKEYANDVSNAMSDAWLSMQYGWKPLLQDVYGAAETLAQASLGPENRNAIYAVASGSSRKDLTSRKIDSRATSGTTGYDSTVYECKGSYSVRYKVRYTRSSPPTSSLAKLGILNPLALAWELTPYSFVVDWFFPIGNWLGGLDASAGLAFESGFKTTLLKVEQETTQVTTITWNPPTRRYSETFDKENRKYVTMQRDTLSAFPFAPAPTFKNPLSFSHMLSAMALLKQFKR